MEYFYISQDKRYRNSIEISGFSDKYYPNLFTTIDCHRIPDKNVVYSKAEKEMDMNDVIGGPIFFVSEEVKKVLCAYDDTICFKLFFILNMNSDQGGLYFTPIMPEIDCLRKNKIDNKLYLNVDKTEGRYICCAKGSQFKNGLIVNMEVAESLLRRRLKGIVYQRLEVESCLNIL